VVGIFVDELDLGDLGFSGVDPEATGRPAYHPSVLLKQRPDFLRGGLLPGHHVIEAKHQERLGVVENSLVEW
jgi:hypothetical protein